SQVAANQALLDGAEHRLVGLDVDVHVLELADLLPVAVDQRLAVPLGDVLVMGHCFLPPAADAAPSICGQLSSAAGPLERRVLYRRVLELRTATVRRASFA